MRTQMRENCWVPTYTAVAKKNKTKQNQNQNQREREREGEMGKMVKRSLRGMLSFLIGLYCP